MWMFAQTRAYVTTDLEKAMRWLGFIQGVLWSKLGFSIDQMREDNTAIPESVTIIVNGKDRSVSVPSVSFVGVVQLAHPMTSRPETYTVTYRHGRDGGTLTPGEKIAVQNGMVFNVMQTGNA